MAEVAASRKGRSLNRSPAQEYATTANRLTASTSTAAHSPRMADQPASTATNGTGSSTDHASTRRRTAGSPSTEPSTPPLRGLRRSEAKSNTSLMPYMARL